ncbi:hypothetical protein L3X38_002108 [Prunus dulcis]|uniref:Uncharacterized protein n=1 Tax=Prunus dulcis TaxID=3755 RepID=A0AAD4ZKU1_PRUDU|nr:hypothetical protein L3X38_002108 [Prunus dulcis]
MFAQQPAPFKEPDRDVQSLLNLGHVRAEIEFLADVILCKQKMEVSQIHNKEFHSNCSRSKGCNLPSHDSHATNIDNMIIGDETEASEAQVVPHDNDTSSIEESGAEPAVIPAQPQRNPTRDRHPPSRLQDYVTFNGFAKPETSISQGKISETGIPKYSVQIANACAFDCVASDIHVHCGQFASTEVMNPAEFRRPSFDDCLVNNGQPLKPHQLISFTYSNTFMYPLLSSPQSLFANYILALATITFYLG